MPSRLRLLQLEENEWEAGLALALLAEGGIYCQVTHVTTLAGFFAQLATGQPFDLVLCDLSPAIDGFSALAACKESRPDLPFIFSTGTQDEAMAAKALALGASDYVEKFRLSRLAPAVKRLRQDAQQRLRTSAAAPNPPEVAAGADPASPPEPTLVGGSETILLAEDDGLVRTLVRDILNRFGYRVIEAADGREAMALFHWHRQEINLVVLDRVLPRRNGEELLQAMRTMRPGLPALIISGYPESAQDLAATGIEVSSRGFLAKPFAPNQLLCTIRELLERSRLSSRSAPA